MPDLNHRDRLRARLRQQANLLEQSGAAEAAAQEARAAAAAQRARLEATHPEFVDASQRRAVSAWLFGLAILSAWLIDIYLYGALAEYVAGGSGMAGPLLSAAKLLLPGLLIVFDLLAGSLIQSARDRHLLEGDIASRRALAGWTLLGFLLLLAYISLVWATQTISYDGSPMGAKVVLPLTLGLTALALVVHAALIFSGADVKAYAIFGCRRSAATARERRTAARAQAAAAAAVREFNRLSLEIERHNQEFPEAPFRASYSRQVRELLRREFGHDVIAPAGSAPGMQRDPGDEAPADDDAVASASTARPPGAPLSDHEVRA